MVLAFVSIVYSVWGLSFKLTVSLISGFTFITLQNYGPWYPRKLWRLSRLVKALVTLCITTCSTLHDHNQWITIPRRLWPTRRRKSTMVMWYNDDDKHLLAESTRNCLSAQTDVSAAYWGDNLKSFASSFVFLFGCRQMAVFWVRQNVSFVFRYLSP